MTTRKITGFLMKIYEFELAFKADNSGESVYETSNPAAGSERGLWQVDFYMGSPRSDIFSKFC